MIGNRSRYTRPELGVGSVVHRSGLRYRVRLGLSRRCDAQPTWCSDPQRFAVVIDGCPEHYAEPRANTDYWSAKVTRTCNETSTPTAAYARPGWTGLRYWEHEPAGEIAAEIVTIVKARRCR